MPSPAIVNARIGIVGRGRLGTALAESLRAAGLSIEGPLERGATGDGCDIVVLCVPDAEIATAGRLIRDGILVGHTSGATTLAALAPREAFSMHPLLSVTREGTSFEGAGCAIAATSDRGLETARALAAVLGMRSITVSDEDRALYHAAASLASNAFVTVEGAAERLFEQCGVPRDIVAPLVKSSFDLWTRLGARAALTGPVVRGDEETIARQRAAIAERAPDLIPLWDALTSATRALAAQSVPPQ
jgi:predicted short-subunit dehydrogenase-like oxidoreductase (DUF2520 family)